MKIIITIVLLLTSYLTFAQNECYVIEGDQYGAVGFHTDELYTMVCDLIDQMDDLQGRPNSSDRVVEKFTVVTKLHYPILAYAESNFGSQRNEFFSHVESEYASYFALSKEIDNKGITYAIKIKFPNSGIFLTVNQLMLTSITKDVEDVMNGAYKLYKNNSMAEIAGYVKLKEILEDIEGNNFNGDIFERNEFYRTEMSDISILTSNGGVQNINQGNIEIINYGSYGEEGVSISDLPEDLSRIADLNTYNLSMLVVISAKNDEQSIDEILEIIENSEKEIKIWIHLDFLVPPHSASKNKGAGRTDPIIGYILFKMWNNLTSQKAQQICDDKTSQRLDSWTEKPNQGQNPPGYDCSLGWKMGWNCLLPRSEEWIGNSSIVLLGTSAVVSGLFDGLLGNIEAFYNLGKGVGETAVQVWSSLYDFVVKVAEEGISYEALNKAAFEYAKKYFETFKSAVKYAIEIGEILFKTLSFDYLKNMAIEIVNSIYCFLQDMWESGAVVKTLAYIGGLVLFDAVASYLTGGLAKISKVPELLSAIKNNKLGGWLVNLINNNPVKRFFCRLKISDGCFVKDTPVLMASNTNQFSLRNTIPAYAMAALPIVSVPIQDVQLFDYAVAHKSVNSSYGFTANTSDTYVIGKDPYTSDQQRSSDQYEINDKDWNEVTFEQVLGSSKCKLALHNDWINQSNYSVDAIVNMNLPEQGISGPFRITSIKHILPLKKPEADPGDGYEWKPVTGLFIHQSDQVHNISFDNNETIGVTAPHPIFSAIYNVWRQAGELEVGEKVLTYHGEATVTNTEKKAGSEAVYNLEIKDLHNFLVGDHSVVVHNACVAGGPCDWLWDVTHNYGSTGWETALQHIWNGHSFSLGKPKGTKSYFSSLFDKDTKIEDLVTEMTQDWGKFKKGEGTLFDFKEYANGDVRFDVDYSSKPHLLDANGFIGYDKNGNGLTKVRVTLNKDFKIYNAFPANTLE